MSTALLIFPHQLFDPHPGWQHEPNLVVLIEDSLFFGDWQYPADFHLQKLWLHRASMAQYGEKLRQQGLHVIYCPYANVCDLLWQQLGSLPDDICHWVVADPVDWALTRRLTNVANRLQKSLTTVDSPNFLNTPTINRLYRQSKKRWFQTDFYKFQRTRLGILVNGDQPLGDQWTFDADNRLKVPKTLLSQIPAIPTRQPNDVEIAAKASVLQDFPKRPGSLDSLVFPTTHHAAAQWLDQFLDQRLEKFGPYEDAIVAGEPWLWHSVLTPMLNIGLLTPQQVIERTLAAYQKHDLPLASVEGFIRQVIGWREFIRATYEDLGVTMRNGNHWQHRRALPPGFYTATTGIDPIDDTLRRVLKTGYCHHIERLMVLGGFLFLCEVHPHTIYRWFMEMFVDSYDWVMVPNVYAMSQHADGGLITTKPYFSGSAYIRKMSHYAAGPWSELWDALYWRWIGKHSEQLAKNPRWAMMCRQWSNMPKAKQADYQRTAETYLDTF